MARKPTVARVSVQVQLAEIQAWRAAFDEAWKGLSDKIALAIAETVSEYTPHAAHADLEKRVRDLENRNSFGAGAVKGEDRTMDQVMGWAKAIGAIGPTLWPILGAAYLLTHGGSVIGH